MRPKDLEPGQILLPVPSLNLSFAETDLTTIAAAAAVMGLGGFVKGAVGFALPMVALAGLGFFLTAQEAIAIIVLPAAISNVWQMLRQGWAAAVGTFRRFWPIHVVMAVTLAIAAQVVPRIASDTLFAILGITVTIAAALQLLGWRPRAQVDMAFRNWIEAGVGLVAGIIGGITGVWGPIILNWLIALETEKREQVRMLGVNFLIGWWVLVGAHLGSGVLNDRTLPFSAAMLVPVVAGMWLGMKIQDRVDQALFRKLTLIVLCVAGLNLLHKGLM